MVLAVLFFLNRKKNPESLAQESVEFAETNLQKAPAVSNDNSAPMPEIAIPRSVTNSSPQPVVLTNSVEERIRNLEELGTRDDADSFQTIISELKNSDHEVREAALSAVMQFGSQDAIPILKEIATQTVDAREKVAILDAIDFLELPSVNEVRKQRRMKTNSVANPVRAK